ncbi:MAG TPA: hypothetical protein VG755_43125 [Nannocystaceae bacterium]|nr:hypothetical protein [Nannocystaceae bacterium]
MVLPLLPLLGCYAPHQPILPDEGSDGTTSGLDSGTDAGTASASTGATDSATAGDSTSEDATESSTSSETTGADDPCGNGVVEADEDCDDGNNVNGDGCNNDCVHSGKVLWTIDFVEGYEVPDEFAPSSGLVPDQVAVAPDGTVAVAHRILSGGNAGVLVGELDPADGGIHWTATIASASPGDQFYAVGLNASDALVVVCGVEVADDFTGFVHAYYPDGILVWTDESSTPGSGFVDCDILPGGDVITLNVEANETSVRRYQGEDGSLMWSAGDDPRQPFSLARRHDGLISIAVRDPTALLRFDENGAQQSTLDLALTSTVGVATGPDASEYVASASFPPLTVRRYDSSSLMWERSSEAVGLGAIAVDSVGAAIVAGTDNDDIWVRKFSPDGEELWTATHAGNAGDIDFATSVAVGDDDTIVVGGNVITTDGERSWVRKYAP